MTRVTAPTGARAGSPIIGALIAGVLLLLGLGAWAIASPVGSSPDEDFHLASIWCGDGEREGLCAPGSEPDTRMIPDNIEDAICFAHEPGESGACQGEGFLDGSFGLAESDRVNGDGLYPSGYYFWTGLLASDNMVVSVIAMRFAQAFLFTALSIGLWLLLPRRNRAAYVGAIVSTFIPLGVFLIPSINPSGWAIASSALLIPSLVGYLTERGWRSLALGGYAVLAVALGLAARGDSAAYTIIAVLAALVLTFELTRGYWVRAVLPILMVVAAAVAFLSANQTSSALGGGMALDGAAAVPKKALLLNNAIDLPELLLGVLGQNFERSPYTGLGWLDTPLPALVWVPTTLVFGGVLFASFARMDLRRAIALAGVALATVGIPMILLLQNNVGVGWQVQPRYIMPLVVMLMATALTPTGRGEREAIHGTGIDARAPLFGIPQLWAGAALLAVANSVALYTNMVRYVAPGEIGFGSIDWWWRVGPSPTAVWAIGSLAVAALLALGAWHGGREIAAERGSVNTRADERADDERDDNSQLQTAERGGEQRD
ncbi:DUF2142 domain-containing protein [Leucobacter luti]|uniref:DUF2142 domain-containing protein n=1 Tax=Leucobacter luti TaxID=340320 RepID=UPI003CFFA3A2